MKKLGLVALAAMIATGAFAGDHTITAKGRMDWRYQDNDEKKNVTGAKNSSAFDVNYARIYFAGVVTPTMKYTITTNLRDNSATNDKTDLTSTFIKEFYVTKNLAEGFNAMLGKQVVVFGGRENDYSTRDLYTQSEVIGGTPDEQVGLTLSYDVAGQNFQVQTFNGNKTRNTAGASNAQTRMGYGAIWYGNLVNNMVKPIVAYTILPQTTGGDYEYLTTGLQVNMSSFTVEADWDQLNKKDAIAPSTDAKTTSLVGLVRYNHDNFMPFVKYIKDETKKATGTATKERTAWDMGLEYKENKDDALKYHAVYSMSDVKAGNGTKYKPNQIVVGLSFDAAILK